MSDSNGETEVTVGAMDELPSREGSAFDGELETPSHAIVIWTVSRQIILRAPVSRSRTRVRIWVNRRVEPDKVIVAVS
jgi:hypothetical protein